MAEIPGFWDIGPHDPLPVEPTWTEFIDNVGGKRIANLLTSSPNFNNADFLFEEIDLVMELKEVETEFLKSTSALDGFDKLMRRLLLENPRWRPSLLGGDARYPTWFATEFIRLARPGILRILKKANRQIRETKAHFGINNNLGTLVFVNDGFTGLAPTLVHALACDALVHSYSSIDCFLYITLNRYVEVEDSDEPKLIWNPTYSERAPDSLIPFIDDMGRKWFRFLEKKIGPFTSRSETPDRSVLSGAKAIVLPGEERD